MPTLAFDLRHGHLSGEPPDRAAGAVEQQRLTLADHAFETSWRMDGSVLRMTIRDDCPEVADAVPP
ncbi:hypothetical protein ACFVYA_02050 [Amycolatopsis sp. NPDC058278]|uniref:hypothetical protein n=1 Tax=Amycolatopsis sp. NPDC058278 TaxID=3346417 RepID=UPI0036DA5A89